jgi:hypothetical protein
MYTSKNEMYWESVTAPTYLSALSHTSPTDNEPHQYGVCAMQFDWLLDLHWMTMQPIVVDLHSTLQHYHTKTQTHKF